MADASHSALEISHDQRGIQPEHAVTRASQHRIAARLGASLLGVMPAIDLDHQPLGGRQEGRDVAAEQRHLAVGERVAFDKNFGVGGSADTGGAGTGGASSGGGAGGNKGTLRRSRRRN